MDYLYKIFLFASMFAVILVVYFKITAYYDEKLNEALKVRYKFLLKYSYLTKNKFDVYQDCSSVEKSMVFLRFVFKNQTKYNFGLLIHFLDNLNYYLRTIDNFSKELSEIRKIPDDVLVADVILSEGCRLYEDLLEYKMKVMREFVNLEEYHNSDEFLKYKFGFIDKTRLDFKDSFNQLKAELHLLMPHIIMKVETI